MQIFLLSSRHNHETLHYGFVLMEMMFLTTIEMRRPGIVKYVCNGATLWWFAYIIRGKNTGNVCSQTFLCPILFPRMLPSFGKLPRGDVQMTSAKFCGFLTPPSPLSVPNPRNLPSFGQNLANPLPTQMSYMYMARNMPKSNA